MDIKMVKSHYEKNDPKIFEILKEINFNEWFEDITNEKDYFVSLCRAIVGQQLSGKAAQSIFKKFSNLFEKENITPKNILKLDDQELRNAGLSWGKVKYIKDLAEKVDQGMLKLKDLETETEENIIEKLTQVKGIGQWTAEMFLMFTLKKENIFSHGDLGLKKGFEKIYKKKNPTKIQIEKVVKKWHPFKSYGSIALWHALEKK